MKVFVAGATGAIGRPLVSALVAARHEVVGMTSSEHGLKALQERGAEGVVVDVFDAGAVEAAIRRVRPDAVIDELTSLPRDYTPEAMRAAAERDRKVRIEGGQNVHRAARKAGAKRYVVQSSGFFYGPGAGLASETDSLAVNASPGVSGSVRTYLEIEKRVLGSRDLEGVALRYGFFYGPGTYHDPETGSITRQVRERKYPVIGSGAGVYSFIHVEDAAAATVAALESDPGIYNVVDDDPLEMRVWLPAFANFVGAPPPPHISEQQAQELGPDALYYATRLRGASNDLAKRKLGFSQRRLEWLSKATMESGAGPALAG
ncbi:MAG TPA: NAD(P)-dependent oxidoreductase [Bryobacteraceae bacterium]|nr:NAD(P)-dependent oxidoreductase [Bryobacteraceae bacterium]HPQ14789.1 NAD(P)-dependent oxidoreductase [Bryobacteraceae bacterium]HPU73310.1 NAD(P)-dependent oxidoreductase [Bryobacteraceae bacterium]